MRRYFIVICSLIVLILFLSTMNILATQLAVDSLKYKGYTVKKVKLTEDGYSHYLIFLLDPDKKEVKRFDEGGSLEEWSEWELVDLIKGGNKELIITQYSGGAHCCENNWVYKFDPEAREIFNSLEYGILGFMGEPTDIDGDGNCEIALANMTFDYFYRCCYAASPSNSALFEYAPESDEYTVQNIKFKGAILEDYQEPPEVDSEFVNISPDDDPDLVDPGGYYLGSILTSVLPHLYCGEEEKAWELFDKYYILNDKEEVKELIIEKLKEDNCYQGSIK
jgi:hypothetical protein